jgi:hypothetical protein
VLSFGLDERKDSKQRLSVFIRVIREEEKKYQSQTRVEP